MESTKRKLPVDIQSFEELRKQNYVYVDKTDFAWHIVNDRRVTFLSRPRRFGKSLLTDTIQCYLEGKKELFNGLKINDLETEWPKRQVFKFDFSGKATAEAMRNCIEETIADYEEIYGRNETSKNLDRRMLDLMAAAYEQTGHQVGVLFDEYDAPLQSNLYNDDEFKKLQDVYRSFFPIFKTGDKHLKCLFLTGITKFTQLSLFSVLNNIGILSAYEEYAGSCGITKQELVDNFQPEIQRLAAKQNTTFDGALELLQQKYDGYHFSKNMIDVFNPFSVLNALDRGELKDYWAGSGHSFMLNEMLIHADTEKLDIDNVLIDASELEISDVSVNNVKLFLYQTGYLTIKDYDDGVYTLGIPNSEVRKTLYNIVLPNAVAQRNESVSNCTVNIRMALRKGDIPKAMKYLQQLVSQTPYATKGQKDYEDRFRFILDNAFYLCGFQVEEEKQMSNGTIDLVAENQNMILLFELKLESNGGLEAAKRQLLDRNYAAAYSASEKPIHQIAIEFSLNKHGITAWEEVRVS